METIDWNLLKSFAAVLKYGSLSAAARELGATQPTIGRHIDSLEEALGSALFVRSRDGLSPTPEALNLMPLTLEMANSFRRLVESASGIEQALEGHVRATASEIVSLEILPPILARFKKSYPNLSVELHVSNRFDNLLNRDADVAIRMAEPNQKSLIAEKIANCPIGLFAHKSYLSKYGCPENLDDLKQHVLIGPDRDQDIYRSLKFNKIPIGREDFQIRSDNQNVQLQLVRSGAGIGGVQLKLAVQESELIRVMADYSLPMEVWVAMHQDLRTSKRIRVFYNFLVEELLNFYQG